MTDQIPAASTLDSQRRDLKHRLASAEGVGDARAVKQLRAALDENATAKDELLRAEVEAAEAAAAARKAAAEAEGDVEAAAKTPPKGRTAAAPKANTATGA